MCSSQQPIRHVVGPLNARIDPNGPNALGNSVCRHQREHLRQFKNIGRYIMCTAWHVNWWGFKIVNSTRSRFKMLFSQFPVDIDKCFWCMVRAPATAFGFKSFHVLFVVGVCCASSLDVMRSNVFLVGVIKPFNFLLGVWGSDAKIDIY